MRGNKRRERNRSARRPQVCDDGRDRRRRCAGDPRNRQELTEGAAIGVQPVVRYAALALHVTRRGDLTRRGGALRVGKRHRWRDCQVQHRNERGDDPEGGTASRGGQVAHQ